MDYSVQEIREITSLISTLCGEAVSEDEAIAAYEEIVGFPDFGESSFILSHFMIM